MAYTLWRDEIDRERLVAATLAAGGQDVTLPTRYALDVALGLQVEGSERSEDDREWREAVGLPG